MAPYTYTKLDRGNDEIRLMSLMPGTWEEEISFSIFHAPLKSPSAVPDKRLPIEDLRKTLPAGWGVFKNLEGRYIFIQLGVDAGPNSWDHPDPTIDRSQFEQLQQDMAGDSGLDYEALSYTWGPQDNPATARVLGPHPASMRLGANLALALKHLRHTDRPRTLWIDAVCINQDDIGEKDVEVTRMRQIYSYAAQTIIWLGEEMNDSSHALKTLHYFAQQIECFADSMFGDAPGAQEPLWWRPEHRLPYDERTWESIQRLFQRPWFNRVWVLQEALLSGPRAVVQCGTCSIPWQALRKTMMILHDKVGTPVDLRKLMESYRNALFGSSHKGLHSLLLWVRYRHTTDPRDNIYGLLGLVSEPIAKGIRIDYRLPVAEVYKSAILTHINVTKRLDLLMHCRLGQKNEGAPSWVPNFSADRDGPIVQLSQLGGSSCPEGYSIGYAQYMEPDILDVMGVRCATVASVGTPASGDADDIMRTICQWEAKAAQTVDRHGGEPLTDAFLQTIFRGETRERYPTSANPKMEDLRAAYLGAKSGILACKEDMLESLARFNINNLVFTTTREGYTCMAPVGAEEGDLVCVMLGCSRPLLLRQSTSDSFQIVSPCFAYDFMGAEAFLGPLPAPWKAETTGESRFYESFFRNTLTMTRTSQDPRLPPLPSDWEEAPVERNQDDPLVLKMFRNKTTGETIKYDPRMRPESLRGRGVPLEMFRII